MDSFKISIIIPTLNEASIIEKCLSHLITHQSPAKYIKEIIVVDGGSDDQTVNITGQFEKVKLIKSKRGRPYQLNAGAEYATGNIFYFLHADSFPPKNFDQLIVDEVKDGNHAGCFRMKFDSTKPWFRFISWLTLFNHKACRGGDQSQFITKNLFQDIGGYNTDYLIYEDNILIAELYKRHQFKVIPHWLISSSRRFKKIGTLKLQLLFLTIYLKKLIGTPPDKLYDFYKKHIA